MEVARTNYGKPSPMGRAPPKAAGEVGKCRMQNAECRIQISLVGGNSVRSLVVRRLNGMMVARTNYGKPSPLERVPPKAAGEV